uniref:PDE1 N-terminal domain-containing protein n=1 Tax=Hucho hucho TaxID=62062 RepID=A0A4W5N0A8_9TELE
MEVSPRSNVPTSSGKLSQKIVCSKWDSLPRLRCMVKQLEEKDVDFEDLKKNLDYTASLLEAVYIDGTRHGLDAEDDLQKLHSDGVPTEVTDWLASTFTQRARRPARRSDDKPKFRSIVHAVQAGIFVERMFRRAYTAAMPNQPAAVVNCLRDIDRWNFDVFALNTASDDHALQTLFLELVTRYELNSRFKVSTYHFAHPYYFTITPSVSVQL